MKEIFPNPPIAAFRRDTYRTFLFIRNTINYFFNSRIPVLIADPKSVRFVHTLLKQTHSLV
jgi:hypothetical protein